MLNSRDFNELLSLFAAHKVRFLVVGGYAVMRYTEPRYTKDMDLWIAVDRKNATAVHKALVAFGAPLAGLTVEDFQEKDQVYQMGCPPLRVDILMSVDGVDFEAAWKRRETTQIGNVMVPFIARDDLIANKRTTARVQDLLDVANLEAGGDEVSPKPTPARVSRGRIRRGRGSGRVRGGR